MKSRTVYLGLAGILVLGFCLRWLHFAHLSGDPANTYPIQDAEYHDYWAKGLATGNWSLPEGYLDPQIQKLPFFRPPGYPYFLALIYRATRASNWFAIGVQMLLGVCNILLCFLIGRRWMGTRGALIAAFAFAVYPITILFEGELLDPTLHTTLILLTLWLLQGMPRQGALRSFGSGLLTGISALVRANTLLFLPAAALWLGWIMARRSQGTRRIVTVVGLYALGAALAILPATIRNVVVADDLVLISSNAGSTFYMGNTELSTGLIQTRALNALQPTKYRSCFDYPLFVRALAGEEGHPLKHSAASALLIRRTWQAIGEHPGAFLKLLVRKALLFWGPLEIGHNNEIYYHRLFSPVLRVIPLSFALVFALFVTGVLSWIRDADRTRETGILLLLFLLSYFLSILPFAFSSQFRVVLIPCLLLFGAYAISRVIDLSRSDHHTPAAVLAGVFLVAYCVEAVVAARYEPSPARWHYQRGYALAATGQEKKALGEYRRMLSLNPHHAWAHAEIGLILAKNGDVVNAVRHFAAALRGQPDFPKAQVNLGYALHMLGDTAGGTDHLAKVLQASPDHPDALNALAWIRATHPEAIFRDGEEAVRLAHKSCELTNYNISGSVDTLAAAYAEMGRFGEAIEMAERALKLASRSEQERLVLAIRQRISSYEQRKAWREPPLRVR